MNNGFSLRRLGISTLLILSLIVVALPLIAQDALTEVYVTEDESLAFLYPEGWFIDDSDPDITILTDNEANLGGEDPVQNSALLGFLKPAIVGETMPSIEEFLDLMESSDVVVNEVELGERTAFVVPNVMVTENQGAVMAIPLSNGDMTFFMWVLDGDYADYEDTLMAIAETADVFDPAIHSPQAVVETPVDTGEPCLVTAEKAGTAALRVGPGFNRTELSALTPDQPFAVFGEAEADDGSLWWKLDKEEALPQSAAAEIWVNQDDVVASGDCAAIGQADAPPIVPITAPRSPESNNTGTAPASGGGAGAGTGLFIPIPDWQAQLPTEMQASSAETAKYVANINTHWVEVESAMYTSGGDAFKMYRYRVDYDISVVIRETGQEVARQTFRGADPPGFPKRWSYGGRLNGGPPDFGNVLPWLQAVAGQ